MEALLYTANNEEKTRVDTRYPQLIVADYHYEDLVPGNNLKRNKRALRRFYGPGYRFFYPLMMWYLENGMIRQYLNAARAISYCDRDSPDFWLIVKRASEIANQYPDAWVVAVVQYYIWRSINDVEPVPIFLPTNPKLRPFNEFLTKNLIISIQSKWLTWSHGWGNAVISKDIVYDLDREFEETYKTFISDLENEVKMYSSELHNLLYD